MAVEFLLDEQAAGYGRFEGEPTQAELERFFFHTWRVRLVFDPPLRDEAVMQLAKIAPPTSQEADR